MSDISNFQTDFPQTIEVNWGTPPSVDMMPRIFIEDPGMADWQQELMRQKFDTLDQKSWEAWRDGFHAGAYTKDIGEAQAKVAKYENGKLINDDYLFGEFFANKREGLIYIPESTPVNVGELKSGFAWVTQSRWFATSPAPGKWEISTAYHWRLAATKANLYSRIIA